MPSTAAAGATPLGGMLDRELATYDRHRRDLLANAEGRWVLVHADDVVGTWASQLDALTEGYKRFGDEPFLVKQVVRVELSANFVSHDLV